MTTAELWLRPPTQDEFEQWLPRQEAAYAREIAESGAMSATAAAEKARLDIARRFSSGLCSPGQVLFRLMAGDEPVGWLWLNVPVIDGDPLMAWVNDVEVDPGYRGRGYGRAAMLLAEGEARARGMASLGLNVHGQNTPARSLYDSLGYQVMTQQMRKPLLRPPLRESDPHQPGTVEHAVTGAARARGRHQGRADRAKASGRYCLCWRHSAHVRRSRSVIRRGHGLRARAGRGPKCRTGSRL